MPTELRLQRQLEHNKRLREQLEQNRISVSQASASLIKYCQSTKDYLLPMIWGTVDKRDDPFVAQKSGCGCSLM
ncbi:hypothetical protein BGW42_001180 [Actinomortierella wolfii]|nr:hypothetical protein BGZ73_007111 [Actinomortierella ambigua]KAG0230017.1 hypothetical protein BGW42_001180 [Actinomortierella wolfii]KAG0240525.1 hypothetical protein BGW41_006920 [Actinomortierella wolfii]